MFFGTYRHTVDAKGRVALPAQFRRDLGSGAVIAPGSEGRLVIRPAAEWQQVVDALRLTGQSSADQRRYMRNLFADAREVELDAQGRVLLTAEHRRFAGIAERAVFVGVSNVVEVVGEETWDAERADFNPEAFTELGDRVGQAAPPAGAAS